MTGRQAAKRSGRRTARKAAGILLLGLLVGFAGCRWPGDHSAAVMPILPAEKPLPPTRNNSSAGAVNTESVPSRSAPSSASPELTPVCYEADPDGPRTEESDRLHHEMLAGHLSGLRVSATPIVNNQAQEVKDEAEAGKEKQKAFKLGGGYQVDLRLPSPAQGMDTPVIPPPQKCLPLTLAESLAYAGAANPTIALAQQAVRLSQAEMLQASVLLLPNINVGAGYDNHTGPLQASFGAIRKVDRNSVIYGLGTYSLAAENVKIPGLFINKPLAEVFFEPLVARQVVANRRFTLGATNNQILLEVSTAYVDLLGAEARLAVIRQSIADFNEVARLTEVYARTGAGRQSDANRARAEVLSLEYAERQAQAEVAIAAADLARLLNLDPSVRLQTGAVPIQIVIFVDPKTPLPQLLEIASRNRPEMMAIAAEIRANQIRVKREIARPLIPTLWAGFSADEFGGGAVASTNGNVPNPHTGNVTGSPSPATGGQTVPAFGRVRGRTDIDVICFWTLQGAGLGNYARVRQNRATLNQSYAERLRILNEVRREVSVAYNTSAQQFFTLGIERRRVQESSTGFQRDLDRLRGGVDIRSRAGRPIEALRQAQNLYEARLDLLAALVGFDRAQFQLFVALGQPPTLVVEDDKTPPPPVEMPTAELPPAELPPPNVLPPAKQ